MAITNKFFIFLFFLILLSCSNKQFVTCNFDSKSNTSKVFLIESNKKKDSIVFNSFYGKDSLQKFARYGWNYTYICRCGTGCSLKKSVLLSIYKNKLISSLVFEAYYKEGVLGDTTFKKNFIRKTDLIKNNNQLYLKRTCLKNDIEYFSKIEKLQFDLVDNIYFNKKFNFENNIYKGIKIDSTEYIYYLSKWYEYDDKEHKLYQEL